MIFYKISLLFNINFLFGFRFFYFRNYSVKFPVLIPRNESCLFFNLVYNFIDYVDLWLLDAGCGSGALSYFFVKLNKFNILSVDIKCYAIFLCYKNFFILKQNNFNITQCDWSYLLQTFKCFNVVICNPPYLSFSEFNFFNDKLLIECKNSLFSECNGFYALYFLLSKIFEFIEENGVVFLEHGYSQAKYVRNAMIMSGFMNVYTYSDYLGIARITIGEK